MTGKRAFSLALSAALALSCLAGCGASTADSDAEPENAGIAVHTQAVTTSAVFADSSVSGTVTAEEESSVMVAVSAKCLDTYAAAGDHVEAGQVLCRLDLVSTISNYNAARLAYNAAQQSYSNQSASFEQQIAAAQQSVEFYEKMLSDTQALFAIGAASQLEVDQVALQLQNARTQLQSAISGRNTTLSQLQSSIQSSLSTVQQLQTALENIDGNGNVIAPISGILVSMNAVKDGYVSASAPVAVINGTGRMEISVSVSEAMISKLHTGDEASVNVTAAGKSFSAKIKSMDQAANSRTKLYDMKLTVPEEVTGLFSGMFADVTFRTDTVENTVVVPSEAILTSGTTKYVYIVENGAARYVEVQTGMTGDGVTQIVSGLEEGQTLVTVGQSYLSDGAAVRVIEEG